MSVQRVVIIATQSMQWPHLQMICQIQCCADLSFPSYMARWGWAASFGQISHSKVFVFMTKRPVHVINPGICRANTLWHICEDLLKIDKTAKYCKCSSMTGLEHVARTMLFGWQGMKASARSHSSNSLLHSRPSNSQRSPSQNSKLTTYLFKAGCSFKRYTNVLYNEEDKVWYRSHGFLQNDQPSEQGARRFFCPTMFNTRVFNNLKFIRFTILSAYFRDEAF